MSPAPATDAKATAQSAATAKAATKAESKTAATPVAKGKARLLIIIAAAVVLLGGGAGAFFFLKGDSKKATTTATVEHREAPKLPAIYVPLDPPFVVNFDGTAAARFLQVTVQLMTRDQQVAEFAKAHEPAIRNDLLLLLGNQKVEEVSTREGKETLRAAALEAVRKIIAAEGGKPEGLEALYFTTFVMQ
jgi:flagellar FliL protein